jgi:pSer/pThr/pTyr-binding forkhead associated (FHA) protein/uncharacterized protein YoxC
LHGRILEFKPAKGLIELITIGYQIGEIIEMLKGNLSELVSGSMSKIRGLFSNIQLDKISKPVALLGSGILFSILALSPLTLLGTLPAVSTEILHLTIRKHFKRKKVKVQTDEELKTMPVEEMRSVLLELQESIDDLIRKDKETRLQITRLIKESLKSEEFLDYLNEQQSLAVLIQENFRDLLREFPEMSEDICEINGKIDSLMDQVRDVKRLLIELRSDIQKIIAQNTHRRERKELEARVAVTLGRMRTSSNLPEEMKLAYDTYYMKTVVKKMEHEEYEELMDATVVWETDVAELTKTSARLIDVKGSEFLLSKEPLIIGRTTGYEPVQLEDEFISRVHACLIYDWKSGQYFIRDLNSANGTFLNGKNVKNSPVRSRDEIVIGRTSVNVEVNQKLRIRSATGLSTLDGYLMVLGSSPSSKILFCENPHVSRLHAIITCDPRNNSYRIRDLNSTNKTFVNGERVAGELTLRNGDVVSLARTTDFTFMSAQSQHNDATKLEREWKNLDVS